MSDSKKSFQQTGTYSTDKLYDQNQYAYYVPQQQYYTYPQAQSTYFQGWVDYRNPSYVKGAVVGAAVTLLLTNPTVKKTIIKSVVGIWGMFQGGVEELKEQIRDVQAVQGEE